MYEEFIQRGLSPLDLGGEHRFLSDEGVEQQVDLGQCRRRAVESPER